MKTLFVIVTVLAGIVVWQYMNNCKGMGKIVVDLMTHPPRTANCALCNTTGVVSN